jgi:hypothetical protein
VTRRPGERHRGRLLRMRALAHRAEHGLDWALALARPETGASADPRSLRALAEENAVLARELARVQARCTQWRDDCIAQAERLQAQLMRARADAIARQTRIAALEDALHDVEQRAIAWRSRDDLRRQVGALRARNETLEAELRAHRRDPGAEALHGVRHVLCVGGRARQVPVYRELVERGGAHFDHVDGADPSCLPRLRLALADADVVILQPGYVCQGACRVVEQHCARSGVRCVQLDKACAIGFADSLADAIVQVPPRAGGTT